MSRKTARHVNHERWLISYADFITLLFAFFVVLFASSQADRKKQIEVANAMKTAFTQMGVFDPNSKTLPLTHAGGAESDSHNTKPAVMPAQTPQSPEQLKQSIDKLLTEQVRQGHLKQDAVTTRITPQGLIISLHDAGFFASGSAEVNPSSMSTLTSIVRALPNRAIRVEGHTDNVPIHTELYATNWELSTARAAVIARFIIDKANIDPDELSAAGYAEYHPVASNDIEAGRTQNRRVDIILLTNQAL
jgi:chemotaxis protein MotB